MIWTKTGKKVYAEGEKIIGYALMIDGITHRVGVRRRGPKQANQFTLFYYSMDINDSNVNMTSTLLNTFEAANIWDYIEEQYTSAIHVTPHLEFFAIHDDYKMELVGMN